MTGIMIIMVLTVLAIIIALTLYIKCVRVEESLIDNARARSKQRTKTLADVSFTDTVQVDHYGSYDELTDSQMAVLATVADGFRPEIIKDTYKYKGAPRNTIAGVPEEFGKDVH